MNLLQIYKTISIELLATIYEMPIQMESRRKAIQRFLALESLVIAKIWFMIIKNEFILKTSSKKVLLIIIDRTQWKERNLLMVSMRWKNRAIPIYWIELEKAGNSNLLEQKKVLKPLKKLLQGKKYVLLADREFGNVNLGK